MDNKIINKIILDRMSFTTSDFPPTINVKLLKNQICFPELTEFNSETVCVINNISGFIIDEYHGLVAHPYKNQKIVIYCVVSEALPFDRLEHKLKFFSDRNSFTILLTVQEFSKEIIEQYQQQYNCKIISMPSAYSYYTNVFQKSEIDLDKREFTKYFLSLNRVARPHRQALFQFLVQFNLLDKFNYSYHSEVNYFNFVKSSDELYDRLNKEIGTTWYNDKLDLKSIFKMLPITGTFDKSWTMGLGDTKYYENSFLSVITETGFFDPLLFDYLTEKSFKPLAMGHPFLLLSTYKSLANLKNLGFETCSSIFDESYDDKDIGNIRLESVFLEILKIYNKPKDEIYDMYNTIKPVLKHNYEHFWYGLPAMYKKDIASIKEQIRDILSEENAHG